MIDGRTLYVGAMDELRRQLMPASVIGNIGHLQGLSYLVETITDGLCGKLKPAIYVASIDPGLGKTLAAITVLRQWKDQGFYPQSSVLIVVSTMDEIKTYASGIGLEPHEFAVLTGDAALNALGCPENEHENAPVMFTTHQMLKSRSKDRSFLSLCEFHYHGERRKLLLWDESIEIGKWTVWDVSRLGAVRDALPRGNEQLGNQLFKLEAKARSYEKTGLITIPQEFASASSARMKNSANKQLGKIRSLAGSDVLLSVSGDGHRSFIWPVSSLPTDLAPMIVMDASARVRLRYGLMNSSNLGGLELPKVQRDYSNLNIHVWERGSGKSALSTEGGIAYIAKEIANRVNESNGGDWLIIHYKDCPQVVEAIRSYISRDVNATIHSTHWGRHTATNEFSHVTNVVLIGQPTYAEEAYYTQCYAAAGRYMPDNELPTLEQMKVREYQHHYLQASCRGSIRNGQPCNLYLVVTPTNDLAGWLTDTFPNATITRWKLSRVSLTGRKEEAIEYLRWQFADPQTTKVSKKHVRMAVNMTAANFRNQVQKHNDFREVLESEGLVMAYNHFERQPSRFGPCGGDFDPASVDDL